MAAILLFSYQSFAQGDASSDLLPRSVMNAEIKSLDGTSFRLAERKGKAQILLLWASWCGPCRSAADALNKVLEDYAKQSVEIIGLTFENPKTDMQDVLGFVRANKPRFEIGWVDEETAKIVLGKRPLVPQILVVTNDGHVINRFIGFAPDRTISRLNEAIRIVLAEKDK